MNIADKWKYSVLNTYNSSFLNFLIKQAHSIAVLKEKAKRVSPYRADGVAPNSAATVRLPGLHSVPTDVLGLHRGVCQRHWSYMESCYDVVSFSLT